MTEQECAELKAKVLKQIATLPDAPWRIMDFFAPSAHDCHKCGKPIRWSTEKSRRRVCNECWTRDTWNYSIDYWKKNGERLLREARASLGEEMNGCKS